jgi:hypothetical protein
MKRNERRYYTESRVGVSQLFILLLKSLRFIASYTPALSPSLASYETHFIYLEKSRIACLHNWARAHNSRVCSALCRCRRWHRRRRRLHPIERNFILSNELDFSVNFHSMPASVSLWRAQFLSIFFFLLRCYRLYCTAYAPAECVEWEHKMKIELRTFFSVFFFYGFQRINIYIEPSRKSQLFHILSLFLLSSSSRNSVHSGRRILDDGRGEHMRDGDVGKVSKIWRRTDCIFFQSL